MVLYSKLFFIFPLFLSIDSLHLLCFSARFKFCAVINFVVNIFVFEIYLFLYLHQENAVYFFANIVFSSCKVLSVHFQKREEKKEKPLLTPDLLLCDGNKEQS